MKDSVWKRISGKGPKGAKMLPAVALVSAVVWIGAIAVFFLFKGGGQPEKAEGHGHGGAMDASARPGHGGEGGALTEASESDDEGGELPRTETAEERAHAGHGGESHIGNVDGEGHVGNVGNEGNVAVETHAPHAGAEAAEADAIGAGDMPTREEAAALRQVAELLVAAGDKGKAVTPMRRVLRAPGADADLLAMATDVFLATGHYREAVKAAERMLSMRPGDMRVKVQSVEARYRMGEVEKAMAEAREAIKEHPGELAMLTALGTMEVEQGPRDPAYGKSLQAALKLKPDYVPALYQMGRKAQLEGNYKDAETAFRKVVKLDPDNAKAHGQLGMAYYHLGKENEAEKEYRIDLGMNPGDYNTWFNLGELRMARAGREIMPAAIQTLRAEAMEAYLKALEANPDHAQAHYRVGVLLNGNGQYKEAIRHLEAALRVDSRHVPTLVQLSLAFENLKQPARARAYLNKAYELDPLNKLVLFKLKQLS
jgi:tetratricopeptide (TPR) repeat protein